MGSIGQRGAIRDEPVAGTRKHLNVELLSRFEFNEPHRRSCRRFGDRLCVTVGGEQVPLSPPGAVSSELCGSDISKTRGFR